MHSWSGADHTNRVESVSRGNSISQARLPHGSTHNYGTSILPASLWCSVLCTAALVLPPPDMLRSVGAALQSAVDPAFWQSWNSATEWCMLQLLMASQQNTVHPMASPRRCMRGHDHSSASQQGKMIQQWVACIRLT